MTWDWIVGALALLWLAWRLLRANRDIDRILADVERLQQGRPTRYARGCEQLGQCTALLRGDDETAGGAR